MSGRLIFIGIFVLSCLLTGCGIRPQVDFYVSPIVVGEGQKIDAETGAVTMEEEGVSITVSAVDTVDLLNVTSDADVNPYIYVSDWGTAKPRYTVFDVSIKNNRESEVQISPGTAVLMDDTGEQYEAIPYATLRERYGSYPDFEREIVYYTPSLYPPPPRMLYYGSRLRWRPWYYHYDLYDLYWSRRPGYVQRVYSPSYFKRAVINGTMLKAVKLYPGGKRRGFIIFPRLAPGVGSLKLIVPGITFDTGEKSGKKAQIEFQFHFERVPAVKTGNVDKGNAGTG